VSLTAINSALMPPQGFLFGGTGSGELLLIFVVLLLLFGPRKLPEIARMIGKALSQLRNASNDFRDQIMKIEETEEKEPEPAVDVASEDVDTSEDKEPLSD